MEHTLSITEALRFGWHKTRAHSVLIFQVLLTLFAIEVAQQVVSRVLAHSLEGALAAVILWVGSVIVGVGLTVITLRIARGHATTYQDIIPPYQVCITFLGATVLAGIVTVLPLILALILWLIAFTFLPYGASLVVAVLTGVVAAVATVYLGLRYAFVRFAVLDDQQIVKSLRDSAHLTRGRKWHLAGFFVVLLLLNILGAALLLVGLLVTIPVSMIAYAHLYDKTHAQHHRP